MLAEFSEAADTSGAASGARRGDPEQATDAPEPIRYVVVEMTPVTSIDSTALHMLEDMHRASFARTRGRSPVLAHGILTATHSARR